MSISRHVTFSVWCDGSADCEAALSLEVQDTKAQAIQAAVETGWIRVGDKFFCPGCAPTLGKNAGASAETRYNTQRDLARKTISEGVDKLDDARRRLFAADCAEDVLYLFERERPTDDRARKAIAVAREYARGAASAYALAAAHRGTVAAIFDAVSSSALNAVWAASCAADIDHGGAIGDAAFAAAEDAGDAVLNAAGAPACLALVRRQVVRMRRYLAGQGGGSAPKETKL